MDTVEEIIGDFNRSSYETDSLIKNIIETKDSNIHNIRWLVGKIADANKNQKHSFNQLQKHYKSQNERLKYFARYQTRIDFNQRTPQSDRAFIKYRGASQIKAAWNEINHYELSEIPILLDHDNKFTNDSFTIAEKSIDDIRKIKEKIFGIITIMFTGTKGGNHAIAFIFKDNTFQIFDSNGSDQVYLQEISKALKSKQFNVNIIESPAINFGDTDHIFDSGTPGYCLAISLMFLEIYRLNGEFFTYQEISDRMMEIDDIINTVRRYAAYLYEKSIEKRDSETDL